MQPSGSSTGQPAPIFSLQAIGSGRTFQLADFLGKPVLLLFVDYNTGRSTREVVMALRSRYPDFEQIPIALIVDLRIVPKLLRGAAGRVMESAFHQASAEVPDGYDPADHLILLPDWNGQVFKAYGIGDVNRHMQMVLIGRDGMIREVYQGPNESQVALDLVQPYLQSN